MSVILIQIWRKMWISAFNVRYQVAGTYLFKKKTVFQIPIGSGYRGLLDPDLESGSESRGLKKDQNVK